MTLIVNLISDWQCICTLIQSFEVYGSSGHLASAMNFFILLGESHDLANEFSLFVAQCIFRENSWFNNK